MATSGSIAGTAKKGGSITANYTFWLEWKRNSYSIANNTSNITVSLKIKCTAFADGAWNLERKPSVSLRVNLAYKTPTINFIDTRNYATCTFATWTGDVSHNDDGSLSCPISASFDHYGSNSLDAGTVSGYAGLDTIPRASTISSASNVTLGNKCSIKWTPKAASFRYRIAFFLGDWSATTGVIHPNTTSAYTYTGYTIPLAVANQITNDRTGTMTAYLVTYSDSGATTEVGSADSATFTVTVPDNGNTKPAVTMSLSPVSSLGSAFSGLYIQGKTKVKATLSATGKYGAGIKAYSMNLAGTSYGSGAGYTSNYLSTYGSLPVYGYATDSRGISGSTSGSITVLAYSAPKITVSVCGRCDEAGNLSDSGTYLKIKASRSYSTVTSGGVQKNFCMIRFRYKAASASAWSSWVTILDKNSLSSNTVEMGALLGGLLAIDNTYQVQVQAIDDIGDHAETTIEVPTEKVHTHRAKNSIGFGKYSEVENCLDMGWDIELNSHNILRNGKVAYAPTGYGLGEGCQVIDSVKNIPKNGWWLTNVDTPDASYWYCHSRHSADNSIIIVDAWRSDGLHQAVLSKNGTWGEWEWINPALNVGVEYRTTERWYSYPVYVKMVDMGALPTNSRKTIQVSDHAKKGRIISASGFENQSGQRIPTACFGSDFSCNVGLTFSAFTLSLMTNFDGSHYGQSMITVKYIKY